jgi:hypothetical protein
MAHRFRLIVLSFLLFVPTAAVAGTVDVPMLLDAALLERSVAAALALGADGTARLTPDACSQVDLADLHVVTEPGGIVASLAVTATAGVRALGRCRGPGPWHGRMNVVLVPAVALAGLAIDFSPESAELVRPDGTPGPLTAATRLLAERVILPHLERTRIDLEAPLAAFDELLREMMPAAGPGIGERARIETLTVDTPGLEAMLRFEVAEAPAAPVPLEPEPALDPAELAAWQRIEDELDGFLTTIITALAKQARTEDQRVELLGVLLDARHRIAEALAADETDRDPVRELFVDSWNQLRPWLAGLEPEGAAAPETGLRLAAFIAGGDAIRALDHLGPRYGLEVTRDGLRRLARLLLADDAPDRFTPLPLELDPVLQELFKPMSVLPPQARARWRSVVDWLMPPAHASTVSPAEALRGRVPRLATLEEYLQLVADLLLEQTMRHLGASSKVPAHLVPRFDPLVRATAWKESCWRQFIGSAANPRVLTSPAGAIGMMQINGRVWRGMYDLRRLAEEVDYNVAAGTQILEHYLVDYAIRRAEHEQPGGDDNLIRATYAAYNGGPSQLTRYRRANTAPSLRAIDAAFWRYYRTVASERWPEVASCYAVQRAS